MYTEIEARDLVDQLTKTLFPQVPELLFIAVIKKDNCDEKIENSKCYDVLYGRSEGSDEQKLTVSITAALTGFGLFEKMFIDPDPKTKRTSLGTFSFLETPPFETEGNFQRIRPFKGGYSGANFRSHSTGTLGCSFQIRGVNDIYVLSNWHVLCGEDGDTDDCILQPGRHDDGDRRSDVVGELYWYKLDDKLDAAIFKVLLDKDIEPGIEGIGDDVPKGIDEAKFGEFVIKSGRTTGVTEGKVLSNYASVKIPESNKIFNSQILSEIETERGDSGSAILNEHKKMIGLHFASNRKGISIANNINYIFKNRVRPYFDDENNGKLIGGFEFSHFYTKP